MTCAYQIVEGCQKPAQNYFATNFLCLWQRVSSFIVFSGVFQENEANVLEPHLHLLIYSL
jgi:hypothetical protein